MKLDNPYTLFLLIVPLLVLALALFMATRNTSMWANLVAPRLRPSLIRRSSPWPRWVSLSCLILSSILLIAGIARLQIVTKSEVTSTKGRNIVLVLDISRSMGATDLKPTRLAQAKVLLYELLDSLPNDRLALVAFAGYPYLFAPLTHDHNALRETIEQIDFDSIPRGGSDLAAAIELGVQTLKETAQANNGMIILSDGEEHEAELMQTVDDIKKSSTYTFTIGIGTSQGGTIEDEKQPDRKFRDNQGNIVITRLNTSALEQFSARTNGRFAIAASASNIPSMVTAAVADLDAFERKGGSKTVAKELFPWFIIPAIALLFFSILVGTRWQTLRPRAASALFLFCCIPSVLLHPIHAAEASIREANAALAAGDYSAAAQSYESLAKKETPSTEKYSSIMLGKATAHYRLKEYTKAREAYSNALESSDTRARTNAHQGMGNTLFQLGWQTLTEQPYPAEKDAQAMFDAALKKQLDAWLADTETSGNTSSDAFRKLESIMLNWADAVRHTQSADTLDPSASASHNGEIARTYLKKLRQKMEEQQQEMQQMMGGTGEGEGEEQGDGDQEGEGEGDEGGENGKEGKNGDQKGKDGKGKNGDKNKNPSNGPPPSEKPDPKNEYGKDGKQGETPQEKALRKLKENADIQRGAVAPGGIEYREPEKNW